MVDIHSHVLYGMDDGSKAFEISVAMLRMAAEHGTTDIVASPHANLNFYFQPEEVSRQIAQFSSIPGLPQIHTGCDFHLSFDNIQDFFLSSSKYTINGLRYLLVEFADFLIPSSIDSVFGRMLSASVTPIITHPERNPMLSKNPKQLEDWVAMGCRIQVTGQSLTGRFGKHAEAAARQFLESGLVHFVASDGHDVEHRPPVLRPAYDFVVKECGDSIANTLFLTNPTQVLTGGEVSATPEGVTTARRWFKLW